jgi:alpha-beta hydrolase superfamily lysophospholipase
MPYETYGFPAADGNRLEGWFLGPEVESRQPWIAMFPGYSKSKDNLLPEAVLLCRKGYPVLLVDFRGCGGSEGSTTTVGYEEASDVIGTVEFLLGRQKRPSLILYGRSMGSAAILRAFHLQDLPVDGVILECPFDRLVTTLGHRFSDMGLPAFPFAHLLTFWAGVLHGYNGFEFNPVAYATRVEKPCLLLHGREDPRVKTPEIKAIHHALAGPKELHLFEGLGHESFFKALPQEYDRVVTEWLDNLQGSAASVSEIREKQGGDACVTGRSPSTVWMHLFSAYYI